MQWLCNTDEADTTFEPSVGNSRSGAPVIASMSGTAAAVQPGWNRGIHYIICIPPLIVSGVVFLYLDAP